MPRRHVFVCGTGAAVRGYLMLSYGHTAVPEERTLHVHELVADDDATRRELLGWLALQRDEWPQVEYHALPEERFDLLLEDARPPRYRAVRGLWAPMGRRIRGPMLRVLDVPGALHARSVWPQTAPVRFTLRVADPELAGNQGPWHVSFDGARVACEPDGRGEAEVELEAAAFAQLYAGELSLSEAVRLGRARCAIEPGLVDALFRCDRTLRLLDEF